jgi:DNA-binding transcriptional LysR family regulator
MIAPVDHPLAERKSVLANEIVDNFLILPKYGKTRTRLNEWLEPVEDDVRISMELDSSEMMKRFVIAGMGVSFVAASNCQEEITAGKLKAISLAPEPLMRRVGLIYRKDKALSKAALGFIQCVSQNLSSDEFRVDKDKTKAPQPRVIAG